MTTEQLAAELSSGQAERRLAAARTLASLGQAAAPAAAILAATTGDAQAGEWCVAALEELGPPPVDQLGALTRLANEPDESIAYWAATLLGRRGPDAAAATNALATAAESHPAPAARERAVWALGEIGPAASAAAATLEALARSDQARLSRLAGQALEAINGASKG
ncbi:MAG: HEAT repeat domain-containing protein [Planctomycetota bacterium]